jgi:hypothetical protein
MDMHIGPARRIRRFVPEPCWMKYWTDEDHEKKRVARWNWQSLTQASLSVKPSNDSKITVF